MTFLFVSSKLRIHTIFHLNRGTELNWNVSFLWFDPKQCFKFVKCAVLYATWIRKFSLVDSHRWVLHFCTLRTHVYFHSQMRFDPISSRKRSLRSSRIVRIHHSHATRTEQIARSSIFCAASAGRQHRRRRLNSMASDDNTWTRQTAFSISFVSFDRCSRRRSLKDEEDTKTSVYRTRTMSVAFWYIFENDMAHICKYFFVKNEKTSQWKKKSKK